MSVVTVRPDSTASSSGITIVPSGTVHGVLSDSSDSTYVKINGSADNTLFTLGFANSGITASAVITQVAVRLRASGLFYFNGLKLVSGSKQIVIPNRAATFASLSTFTAGTATAWSDGSAITVSQLDAVQITTTGSTSFSGSGGLGLVEIYLDITYTADPTVDVTAPSGTILTTSTPAVQWTPTLDVAAGPQTRYRVKIFDSATYGGGGFNPESSTADASVDATGAETSWTPDVPLAADSYRAYVWVSQTVAGSYVESVPDYSAFTIGTIANPATPTLTVTNDDANARIQVAVSDNAGDATTDALEIQRSVDSGTTWEPMRLVDAVEGVIQESDTTSYDYESSNGQTVSYRARALHNVTSDITTVSAWTATGTGSWTDASNWWLKSPLVPALNTTITVYSFPGYTRAARTGLFQPLGGSKPIAAIDTRGSATGQIVLLVETEEQQAALDAILEGGGALLLQPPAGVYWDDKYVTFGDQGRNRLVDKSWIEPTLDTYTWTEIEAPSGNVSAWP